MIVQSKDNQKDSSIKESVHLQRIRNILNQPNVSDDDMKEVISELAKHESETKSRAMIDSFNMWGVITNVKG